MLAISLIAFSLAMMSATLLVKRVHQYLRPQQAAAEEENYQDFSPFGFVKKIADWQGFNQGTMEIYFEDETIPVREEKELVPPFLAEGMKTEDEPIIITFDENSQVKHLVPDFAGLAPKGEINKGNGPIVITYDENPKVKNFVQDFSGLISKEDLQRGNFSQIASRPEVRAMVMKYAQDQEFRELLKQVMINKDISQLANGVIKVDEVHK